MSAKPWYLGVGPEARAERVRRGLETEQGDVLALADWEVRREQRVNDGVRSIVSAVLAATEDTDEEGE